MDDFGTYLLVLRDLVLEELEKARNDYHTCPDDCNYFLGKISGLNDALRIIEDFMRRYIASSSLKINQSGK